MKLLFDQLLDPATRGLEKAMDLTWRRNEAISSNIANAETPGYRAVDLTFAGELERAFGKQGTAVTRTNPKHIDLESGSSAHLIQDITGATKPDGNNVDIDVQMGQLAFNGGKYSGAVRLLRKKMGLLRMAIREGGR